MMEQFHQKNYGSDVNNSIVFTKQSILAKTSFQRKTQVDRDIPKSSPSHTKSDPI